MSSTIDLLNFHGRKKTPFVPQGEAGECALACIAMVLGHYGHDTDLISLRRKHSTSLKGANLVEIIKISEALGFNCSALRGEPEDLKDLHLPAVLHWNANHFVVLTSIKQGVRGATYYVNDPACGSISVSEKQLSNHWTGVALELEKSETFKARVEKSDLSISQLWSSTSGFWQSIGQVFLLSLILQIAALTSPFFLQISIDTVFPSFDEDLLLVLAAGFGGIAIISFVVNAVRNIVLVKLSNALSFQMIVNLFRHLLRLELSYFEKRHVGDIISRFGSTQHISRLISEGLIAAVIDGILTILTLVLMIVYSPVLSAIAVAALISYLLVWYLFYQSIKLQNLNAITSAAKEESYFIETIRGISSIKAFGQEENRQRLWQRAKAKAVNAQITLGRTNAGFDSIGQFIMGIEKVLFVYVAVSLAFDAVLTIGMIFAFQAYRQQFLDAGMRLTNQIVNLQIVNVHLSRIADIALTSQEASFKEERTEAADFSAPISLENVSFTYGANEAPVFRSINIEIPPGSFVALTGPSGGGKTTLLKLIIGMLEPRLGQIRLGGRPIRLLSRDSFRRSIATVMQGDTLFAGSIAENISFFDPNFEIERIKESAKQARIHDEIEAMPMGYETHVGDLGSALSSGQLQRVLLARALHIQPKILILDEAMANLDQKNESSLLEMISDLRMTRILVTHNMSSTKLADVSYWVDNGEVKRIHRAVRGRRLENAL